MKKAMLAMALLAGSAFAGPRISIGIGFGAPAPVAFARPACPGPGYVWVDGYNGPRGAWTPGFWRAPVAVAPRVIVQPHRDYYDRGHDRDSRRDFHRDFRRDFRR
jgi:hypothetical protein